MAKRTRSDSPTKTCTLDDCDRPLRARGLCATHYNQRYQRSRHRKREVPCVVCGTVVLRRVDNARLDGHCCSVECRTMRQFGYAVGAGNYDWNHDAKQRARQHGCLVIEDVERDRVMQRDDWTCYQCGKDVSGTADPFSPDSATVDHVIPLSKGGEHSMRNVRCCCLACNCSKADRASIFRAA